MSIALFLICSLMMAVNILCFGALIHSGFNRLSGARGFVCEALPVLGMAGFSTYIFLAGYFAGLHPWLLCLPVILVLFFGRQVVVSCKQLLGGCVSLLAAKRLSVYRICIFVILMATFLRLFGVRDFGDALVYHLFLPARYVAAGHIYPVAFSEHALWPQLVGMFVTFALKFDSLAAARAFSYFVFIGLGAFTFLLAKRITKSTVLSLIGSALFLATPACMLYAVATYVDLALALFSTAMVYFLHRYYSQGDRIFLYLAAACCGAAFCCKYTAVIVLLPALLGILLYSTGRKKLFDSLVFLAICFIFSVLWYGWSFVLTGNPVFPYASGIFGSGFTSEVVSEKMTVIGRLVGAHTGAYTGAGKGVINFLLLPVDLAFKGKLFGGEKIGIIYLVLLPFFLRSISGWRKYGVVFIFVAGYAILWFFLEQIIRLLFPVLPVYLCLALAGAKSLWKKPFIKRAFFIAVIPALLVQTVWSVYYCYQDFAYLIRKEPREKYLHRSVRLGDFLKQNPVTDGNILVAGSDVLYYLPVNTIKETTYRNFTGYERTKDPFGRLEHDKIKYVLINMSYTGRRADVAFDPVAFFQSEIGKRLTVLKEFLDEERFLLCRIDG